MNARKIISLFLVIVFAATTLVTPVFASGDKSSGRNYQTNNFLSILSYNPGNGHGNNGNHGNGGKFKFEDSKDVEWATKAIEKLGIEGIFSGSNGKFNPKNNVTELEALTMILNYTGNKSEATKYNTKVHPLYKGAKPAWGLGYLFLAIEKQILLPEELKGFNPNAPAKRHEIAKYIVRALGKTEEANKHMDEDLDFKDASAIPEKSVGYVYVAVDMDLMKGSNNEFQPMKPITKAEMAVILDNVNDDNNTPDQISKRISFVSYDDSADKLTVKQNGRTSTYKVLEEAPVYVDRKYSSLDELNEGDMLELVFNSSNQVIFIEVVKLADNNDNDNDTDLGTQVTASSVSYDNLPGVIQDAVDDLKSDESYKAYRYDGNIYLIAAMGRKNTGGYDIDIDKVYKYKNSDNDYIINVTVNTDSPSSSDNVTQVITYPYDVVKISYFSGIDKVKFLDDDNDKLAETTVSNQYYDNNDTELGDELTVTNMSYGNLPNTIQDRVDSLKSEENYKAYRYDGYVYLIATRGEKGTTGYDIDIDKVYKDKTSDNDYVINVTVDITNPSSSTNTSDTKTYPYDVVKFRYFSGIDTVRFLDDDNDKLAETTINQQDDEQTVSGLVKSINSSTRIIEVLTSGGRTNKYIISSSTPVTVNDDESTFSKIVRNMTVKITLVDSKVISVEAEDTVENLTGMLTGISISTEKTVTVKIGSSYKSYTVNSDTKIYVGTTEKELSDLRINNEVELKLVNGILEEITVK